MYCLKRYDYKHSLYEDRYQILGKADKILFVVCRIYKNEQIRIISASLAAKKERSIYYGQNGGFGVKAWR
ncbi:MAG: BrnT family toxin [Candidatus Margulisbacteria bacterium]|nr:BrnT family toxin [Candidatus Margulisiibacteriota bacterium]